MEKLNVFVILVIGVVCVVSAKSENVDNSNSIDDSWAKLGRQTRKMWSTCKKVVSSFLNSCKGITYWQNSRTDFAIEI